MVATNLKLIDFEKYTTFIKTKYPETEWLKNNMYKKLHKVHSIVYDNMIMLQIFEAIIKEKDIKISYRHLYQYAENINSLLLAFPINHPQFLNYIIRTSTEALLKMIYSFAFNEKTDEKISRIAFRYLKDELKTSIVVKPIRDYIIDLLSIYGKYSENIHQHHNFSEISIKTLDYYTDTIFKSNEKNINTIDKLVTLFIRCVMYIADLEKEDLTFSQSKRIRDNLDVAKKRIVEETIFAF